MTGSRSIWSVVLAAGEGSRLQSLTTGIDGRSVPKQFCSLAGGKSLFGHALERARTVAGSRQVVTVVAAEHRRHWEDELRELPRENVLVQPQNRGTGAGILLPVLAILERDPHASIAVFPSDHHVDAEEVLARAMRQAVRAATAQPDVLVLLGMVPDAPVPDYGWIVPGHGRASIGSVAEFVEKPELDRARTLLERGGLWNSFLFAASGNALLDLFALREPELLGAFLAAYLATPSNREAALEALYAGIEPVDFSRDLLEGAQSCLRVIAVPACGWTDLGTPARVAECLRASRRVAAAGLVESRRPVLAHALSGGNGR